VDNKELMIKKIESYGFTYEEAKEIIEEQDDI